MLDGLVEFVIDRGILAESQRRRPAAAAGIGGTRDRGLVISAVAGDRRLVGQRAGHADNPRRRRDALLGGLLAADRRSGRDWGR